MSSRRTRASRRGETAAFAITTAIRPGLFRSENRGRQVMPSSCSVGAGAAASAVSTTTGFLFRSGGRVGTGSTTRSPATDPASIPSSAPPSASGADFRSTTWSPPRQGWCAGHRATASYLAFHTAALEAATTETSSCLTIDRKGFRSLIETDRSPGAVNAATARTRRTAQRAPGSRSSTARTFTHAWSVRTAEITDSGSTPGVSTLSRNSA